MRPGLRGWLLGGRSWEERGVSNDWEDFLLEQGCVTRIP